MTWTPDEKPKAAASHEPVFNLPPVITGLLVFMLAVQLVLVFGSENFATTLLLDWSFIPARFSSSFGLDPLLALQQAKGSALSGEEALVMNFLVEEGEMRPWTLLTYAALHGSWEHLFLNSVWLAAFGAPLARRIGSERFLMLFGLSVMGGAALHYALNWFDAMPLVGASAGIAGVMASASLFMFQPGAPLSGRVVIGKEHFHPRALRLREVWRDHRVKWFLGIWLALNLLTGLFSLTPGGGAGPIAWEAHLGGFVTGFFAFRSFDPWS
jgi:membrane associated rhomboid family serine protease